MIQDSKEFIRRGLSVTNQDLYNLSTESNAKTGAIVLLAVAIGVTYMLVRLIINLVSK